MEHKDKRAKINNTPKNIIMNSSGQQQQQPQQQAITTTEIKNINNFLNNEYIESKSKSYFPIENPTNSEIFAQVTLSNNDDVELAIDYATTSLKRYVQVVG